MAVCPVQSDTMGVGDDPRPVCREYLKTDRYFSKTFAAAKPHSLSVFTDDDWCAAIVVKKASIYPGGSGLHSSGGGCGSFSMLSEDRPVLPLG